MKTPKNAKDISTNLYPNDVVYNESENVSSDEKGGLQIDIDAVGNSKPIIKKTIKRKRKKIKKSIESDIENFEIDNLLHSSAEKNNLSVANVKNILKRVVTNEHVMAIVQLQEEEEEKRAEAYEPKLTRAKARELQKSDSVIPWALPAGFSTPVKQSEVAVLIQNELPEDSSDEEYHPHEDEYVYTDDEKDNLSTSDIDSQPHTPATPKTPRTVTEEPEPQWTEDGLFKIPPSQISETEETIALRTRSKLSLSETNIETIEQSFVPPDITKDMYGLNFEIEDGSNLEIDDEHWNDFLKDFYYYHIENEDHDEEIDPEYNPQVEEVRVDKEELRADPAVVVSKRELNALIAEGHYNLEEDEYESDIINLEHQESSSTNISDIVNQESEKHLTEYQVEVDTSQVSEEPAISVDCNDDGKIVISVEDQYVTENGDLVISENQRLILSQQIRMHIQLCAQHYLQLYCHPELWTFAPRFKTYLREMIEQSNGDPKSILMTCNLLDAMELCEHWEAKLLAWDTEEMQHMMNFIQNEIDREKILQKQFSVKVAKFAPQFMDTVADSTVFVYPELLPQIPFRNDSYRTEGIYLKSEDHIIAIELQLYYYYIEHHPEKFRTKRSQSLKTVTEEIAKAMATRTPHRVVTHVRNCKKLCGKSCPIQYFLTYGEAPPVKHYLLPFYPDTPPRWQDKEKLPCSWQLYLYKNSRIKDRGLNKLKPSILTNLSKTTLYHNLISEEDNEGIFDVDGNDDFIRRTEPEFPTKERQTSLIQLPTETLQLHPVSNQLPPPPAPKHLSTEVQHQQIPLLIKQQLPIVANNSVTSHIPVNSHLQCNNSTPVVNNFVQIANNNSGVRLLNITGLCNFSAASSFPQLIFIPLSPLSNSENINKTSENRASGCEISLQTEPEFLPQTFETIDNSSTNSEYLCQFSTPKRGDKQKLLPNSFTSRCNSVSESPKCVAETNEIVVDIENHSNFDLIKKIGGLRTNIFYRNICILNEDYKVNYFDLNNTFLKDIIVHIITLQIFLAIYFNNMLPSMPSILTPLKSDNITNVNSNVAINSNVTKPFDYPSSSSHKANIDCSGAPKDETMEIPEEIEENCEEADEVKKQVKVRTPRPSLIERRKLKLQKELQATKHMLTPQQDEERDAQYAFAYYEKVLERLKGPYSPEFEKFVSILKNYDSNLQDPSCLYSKLETIFSPKHMDLLDHFLSFLLPGQASQIGKFMEHFLTSNMNNFIQKLQIYFAKQPAQFRKVMNSIADLCTVENLSLEQIKKTVIPLLKGNALLIEWFLELFPNERPPESDLNDFEKLDIDKHPDADDEFEHFQVPEGGDDSYGGPNCICKCHNVEDEKYSNRSRHCIPCGMKYIQGRVYVQTDKGLRQARITFKGSKQMSEHIKRLSVRPKSVKRKADNVPKSPTKVVVLSPNKSSGFEENKDHGGYVDEDVKKSPKKLNKTTKTPTSIRNKSRVSRNCKVVIREGTEFCKTVLNNKTNNKRGNQNVTAKVNENNAPDSTQSVNTSKFKHPDSNKNKNDNIQVNICDSTGDDMSFTKGSLENEVTCDTTRHEKPVMVQSKEVPPEVQCSPVTVNDDPGSDMDITPIQNNSIGSDSVSYDCSAQISNCSKDNDNSTIVEKDVPKIKETKTKSKDKNEINAKNQISNHSKVNKNKCEKKDQKSTKHGKSSEENKNESGKVVWTREEDTVILKTYQEESCSDVAIINKICKKLPYKTEAEIKDRYQVIMNLLEMKMQEVK